MKMSLGELKEAIENLVQIHGEDVLDLEVCSSSNYGDRARTIQLNCFDSVMLHNPERSVYSDSGFRINEDTIIHHIEEETVVVLCKESDMY